MNTLAIMITLPFSHNNRCGGVGFFDTYKDKIKYIKMPNTNYG